MAGVGGLIAAQPVVNAGLGKQTGSIAAALISFAVGTPPLLAGIVVVAGDAGRVSGAFDVSWYYLLGGVLGAAYRCSPRSSWSSTSAPVGWRPERSRGS